MRVRVLGSAAGGGLPQWNCGCDLCRAARSRDGRVRPRTQSSIAVSADGARWVLVNASPDVRTQLTADETFAPSGLRGSGVAAIALTNADIDHAAGLLVLREGGAPPLYCTERVRTALTDGLRILPVLQAYGPVRAHTIRPGEAFVPSDREGRSLGLRFEAFAVASKPPPYMMGVLPPDDLAGDTVGYAITDEATGAPGLLYVPGVRDLDEALAARMRAAAAVLLDGTCWTDDELVALGVSAKTARVMGHAPWRGDGGAGAFLAGVEGPRKALIHINNTNPVLWEQGPARDELRASGVELTHDGYELVL